MVVSPFTPLFFLSGRRTDGLECPFTQFFATGDRLVMEVITASGETAPQCTLIGDNGMQSSMTVLAADESVTMADGSTVRLYDVELSGEGIYSVSVGDFESEPFEVTSDEAVLGRSVLIEYSPADNGMRRDVLPVIDGERVFFSFRLPGGFKDSGYEFSVDNEQYVSQSADIVELYARESMQETLTVGWSRGVPIWFGQMLNRLLTCRYVYIDGLRYARYESSVPEKAQTIEGTNAFVFTQKLQRIHNLEPTR